MGLISLVGSITGDDGLLTFETILTYGSIGWTILNTLAARLVKEYFVSYHNYLTYAIDHLIRLTKKYIMKLAAYHLWSTFAQFIYLPRKR